MAATRFMAEPRRAAVDVVGGAAPVPPGRVDAPPVSDATAREGRGSGRFIKLLAFGFWATVAILVVSAAVAPGFAIFALLPVVGMPYLVFCWIAWTADRNVE